MIKLNTDEITVQRFRKRYETVRRILKWPFQSWILEDIVCLVQRSSFVTTRKCLPRELPRRQLCLASVSSLQLRLHKGLRETISS